jgi:UDP-2,3-diacylglucosamine pyrophosphatase LpxH
MEQTHTLILSDFHLGSKVSQSEKIIELLKKHQFRKLILLGDIFENLNFKRLKESDWELLSLISQFSKEKKSAG